MDFERLIDDDKVMRRRSSVKLYQLFYAFFYRCLVAALPAILPMCEASAAFEGFRKQPADRLFHSKAAFSLLLERSHRYGIPELAVNKLELRGGGGSWAYDCGWLSSGDDRYRENALLLAVGSGWRSWRFRAEAEYLHLAIQGYGEAGQASFGCGIERELNDAFAAAGGVQRLLSGAGVLAGEITPLPWAALIWRGTAGCAVFGAEWSSFGLEPSFKVGSAIGEAADLTLSAAGNPGRIGAKCGFRTSAARFTVAVEHVPPVGLTLTAGVEFGW